MKSAFGRTDVIGVGKEIFRIPVIELQRNLDRNIISDPLYVDGFSVKDLFVLVMILDKRRNAARVLKNTRFPLSAILSEPLILEDNFDAEIEKRKFSESFC